MCKQREMNPGALKLNKMTKNQKIEAIERRSKKVQFSLNTKSVIVTCQTGYKTARTYNSVNDAYNKIVKGN